MSAGMPRPVCASRPPAPTDISSPIPPSRFAAPISRVGLSVGREVFRETKRGVISNGMRMCFCNNEERDGRKKEGGGIGWEGKREVNLCLRAGVQ